MKKYFIFPFISILISASGLYADEMEDTLKNDFSKQETIKIRFEVNKRLYSFEAGKFKLDQISKNRDKIRVITDRIVPWAIMEHLKPAEVARIIVYMYNADEAGAAFTDSEDLIPLVAKMDIPMKDFVLMVQYNRETKNAGIPEDIRQAFLGVAVYRKWDGVSILAGGRGLILARLSGFDVNKAATLLLRNIPAKGSSSNPQALIAIVENIIGESSRKQNAQVIMQNLASTHQTVRAQENSPAGIKKIMDDAARADSNISQVSNIEPSAAVKNARIDEEKGIIQDDSNIPSGKTNWQLLSRGALISTIRPWLGTPYQYGSKTGRPGIDCSGFTRIVLIDRNIGVPPEMIGHSTSTQKDAGSPVSREKLKPGDLVFFSASPDKNKITHVGLVTGPGEFTHACNSGVINDSLTKKWWYKRYVLSRRIFADVKN